MSNNHLVQKGNIRNLQNLNHC